MNGSLMNMEQLVGLSNGKGNTVFKRKPIPVPFLTTINPMTLILD
jgi:hypothetical protein